jgi:uncharacterized membrane protein
MADQAPQAGGSDKMPEADVASGKLFAILGYLCIIFLVLNIINKKNAFCRYHGWQALAAIIPCIGIVFWIMGLLNAIGGKYQPVPLVGKFLEGMFAKN